MNIRVREQENVPVIEVIGEITDMVDVNQFWDALHQTIDNRAGGIVLDLSRTTWIDSAFISMLITVERTLRERFGHVAVVQNSGIRHVLELSRINRIVTVASDSSEAVAYVRSAEIGREQMAQACA